MARLENKKAVFSCDKCNKSFDFKCPLQADLKNHLHKCKNCNQRFRRMEQHQLSCIDTNNVQFIPSFTTLILPTELLMNPSEFSEQVEQVVPEIKSVQNHPKSMDSILEENFNENKFESLVSEALVNHLKFLNKDKNYPEFHETLSNILGDHLNDETFLKWLANKLNVRPLQLTIYIKKWRDNLFQETRGRQEQLGIRQKIFDTRIKNAIITTDGRNGRNIVKISKRKYLEQYGTITNSDINIEEFKFCSSLQNKVSLRIMVQCWPCVLFS